MSEEVFVRQCAPAMADIKAGNLFSWSVNSKEEAFTYIRKFNRRMASRGMRVIPMRFDEDRVLVYAYRPYRLQREMKDPDRKQLLSSRQYPTENLNHCVAELRRRLNEDAEFPHEVGLFLGYPTEDVKGFIEQGAVKGNFNGMWRSYGNEEQAGKMVRRFITCRRTYEKEYDLHHDLDRLVVRSRCC